MIRIECTGADSLPLDAIEEFQGNLKKRSKKDIDLIITSIEKYGFSFPFFIWNGTGHNYFIVFSSSIISLFISYSIRQAFLISKSLAEL